MRFYCFLHIFAVSGLSLSQFSWAIDTPLRNIEKLERPVSEQVFKVKTAKVVLADYDLIKTDFPSLRSFDESQIDHWLLSQVAYLPLSQISQTEVNTPIEADPSQSRQALRPYHYGRGLVFQANLGTVVEGLIDLKGAGSKAPKQEQGKNGLATLGEAIREFTYEKMVKAVFTHYKSHFQSNVHLDTVGSYAVMDWGFDIKNANHSTTPAGAVLRQAHTRYGDLNHPETYNFLPVQETMEIEKILRRYGISSAGLLFGELDGFQVADLQGTPTLEVVDFGTFLVYSEFNKDVLAVSDLNIEYPLSVGSPDFVQPHPLLSFPFSTWGHVGAPAEAKNDRLRHFAEALARELRNGRVDPLFIRHALDREFQQPVFKRWRRFENLAPSQGCR